MGACGKKASERESSPTAGEPPRRLELSMKDVQVIVFFRQACMT